MSKAKLKLIPPNLLLPHRLSIPKDSITTSISNLMLGADRDTSNTMLTAIEK